MKGLSVHLTDQCNQSCLFCVVDSYKERRENVNKKLVFKFLEENSNKGYEIVNIHGGEATILEDFIEILEKINELGYPRISLQTNGRNLADMEFAKKLVDLNVKVFVVSFHTNNAKEFSELADVDENWLNEIIKGIKNVKSLGAKVRTNTVVWKENAHKLREVIMYIHDELKADHINISAIHPVGRAYKNFNAVTPKITDIVPKVTSIVDELVERNQVVTLEGFPVCLLKEYSKYIVDWEEAKYKLLYHNFILPNYAKFMTEKTRINGEFCSECVLKKDLMCGGIYKEYVEMYGWEEFAATEAVLSK